MICVLTFKGKGKGKVEDRLFGTDRLFVASGARENYLGLNSTFCCPTSSIYRDSIMVLWTKLPCNTRSSRRPLKRVNYILPS
jgi:hypothetical protein